MKNQFRILKSKYGYFYIEGKAQPMFFELSYFEFFLESVLGIKKYVWARDYTYQFKTEEEAQKHIENNI